MQDGNLNAGSQEQVRRDSRGKIITASQLEALKPTQFKPGQSGNPGGRISRAPFMEAAANVARMTVSQLHIQPSDSIALAVAKSAAREAIKGKVPVIVEIANRAEGTPRPRPEYEIVPGTDYVSIEETISRRVEVSSGSGRPLAELLDEVYGLSNWKRARKPVISLPVSEGLDNRQGQTQDRDKG